MKRILFVFHDSNINSGATKSLVDIIDKLNTLEKYEIYVTFPNDNGSAIKYFEEQNIKVFIYEYGGLFQSMDESIIKRILKYPEYVIKRIRLQSSVNKAFKDLKEYNFDLIYTNTITIKFGALLARKLHSKSIWHIREFGLLDHNIKYFLGNTIMEKFINKNSDAVFCVSEAVKNYHAKYIDLKKMYVTYNSYPKSFAYERKKYNLSKKLDILVSGDIKPGKAQFDVVKAVNNILKKYPNSVILHLAGKYSDAAYVNKIKSYIKKENIIDNVILYGQVDNMYVLRKNMDVGIVASKNEAFGRSTIEGMLSSMCMIGRNTGGTPEQIDDGVNGLLYDGTIADLTNKIDYLYLNRDELVKMAKKSYTSSIKKYTNSYSAKVCEKIIDKVLF